MRKSKINGCRFIAEQQQSGMSAAEFCRKRLLNARYLSLRKSEVANGKQAPEMSAGFIRVNTTNELNSKKKGVKPDRWLDLVKNSSRRSGACAGCVARMERYCESTGRRWSKGTGTAKRLAFV